MKIISLELQNYQRLALNNIRTIHYTPKSRIQFILGTNGSGKAQPLSALIKIPNGWSTMGNMSVGTKVTAKDGSVTEVTAIHPQGVTSVYRVSFSDGRSAKVSDSHLWKTYDYKGTSSIVETSHIVNHLGNRKFFIDLPDVETGDKKTFSLSPFLAGLTACMRTDGKSDLSEYFDGSYEQRLELTQSLLDLNGRIGPNDITFTSTNRELIIDVRHLVRSLGGIASTEIDHNDIYTLSIKHPRPSELFINRDKQLIIDRSLQKYVCSKLQIASIVEVEPEVTQCISIGHPEQLYITDDFIVTHNSSLIKELSPLPAAKAEFNTDGFKRIVIRHNESIYELTSDFRNKSSHYSFVKDKEELNRAGTISVFKDLVYKEFNISQDVHNLMVGTSAFHSMSVAERRNWFTKICDNDYTYAIKFYNKLKERHRDLSGGLKLSKARLVQESEKLLSEEEEAALRLEVEGLNDFINLLIETKTTTFSDKRQLLAGIQNAENRIRGLVETVNQKGKVWTNLKAFSSLDELRMALMGKQTEIENALQQSDVLFKKIEENKATVEMLSKSNLETFKDIDSKIDSVAEEINDKKGHIDLRVVVSDPIEAIKAIDIVRPDIANICSGIVVNENRSINRDKYIMLSESLEKMTNEHSQLDLKQHAQIRLKGELEHSREHNKVECPECKHGWSLGFKESTYREVCDNIMKRAARIEYLDKQIITIKDELESVTTYLSNLKNLKNVMSMWSILQPYWDRVISKEYVWNNPQQIVMQLDVFRNDLEVEVKIASLSKELDELLAIKEKLDNETTESVESLSLNIKELEKELYDHTLNITKNKELVDRYKYYIDTVEKLDSYNKSLVELIKLIRTNKKDLRTLEYQESLNRLINESKSHVSALQHRLSRVDSQKAIVDNLKKDRESLSVESRLLAITVNELSPTEGLIAKGLTGFINQFVFKINKFIKTIWLYPLELVPVQDISDTDLDFKFSVRINDDYEIPDVKLGSSAMKEIIDLAFRVVSADYLGLGKAPLFLDEFGVKLDQSHRDSAFYAINNLLNTAEFSQVYMVSHYSSNYGSFKNADITVLSDANISLPKDCVYNKNVTMK